MNGDRAVGDQSSCDVTERRNAVSVRPGTMLDVGSQGEPDQDCDPVAHQAALPGSMCWLRNHSSTSWALYTVTREVRRMTGGPCMAQRSASGGASIRQRRAAVSVPRWCTNAGDQQLCHGGAQAAAPVAGSGTIPAREGEGPRRPERATSWRSSSPAKTLFWPANTLVNKCLPRASRDGPMPTVGRRVWEGLPHAGEDWAGRCGPSATETMPGGRPSLTMFPWGATGARGRSQGRSTASNGAELPQTAPANQRIL